MGTLTSKFEDLTSKIIENRPARAKAKRERLDDARASYEASSESENALEKQVRQDKKQKIKINSSRAKAG